ncbi:MAG TPA: hypothetical protein VFV28_05075, partial [Limnobacter sp.]|nr:hypothetical protein [Limnobacter sp.]
MLTPFLNTRRFAVAAFFFIVITTLLCAQAAHAGKPQPVNFQNHPQAMAMAQRLQAIEGIPAQETLKLL